MSEKYLLRSTPSVLRRIAFTLVLIFAATTALIYSGWLQIGADAGWGLFRDVNRKVHVAFGWTLPGTPDLGRLKERLTERGLALGAPVFMRIFKQEYELELWMKRDGRFVHFATYPICTYSGRLGPKLRQGDRQSPEGFYTVGRSQLNPYSRWRRSFNLGFPNILDASHGRTGSLLMVHGGCSSIGCYAITNDVIDEVWTLINAAFDKGQAQFAVHVFPFRMSDWRVSVHSDAEWSGFWADLKRGYDIFEETNVPPTISVCNKRYIATHGSTQDSAPPLRHNCPLRDETAKSG